MNSVSSPAFEGWHFEIIDHRQMCGNARSIPCVRPGEGPRVLVSETVDQNGSSWRLRRIKGLLDAVFKCR